jgi:AraC-like DNA-binding protein
VKIYIKNMVCNRCRLAVKAILGELNITPMAIDLGEVTLKQDLNSNQQSLLEAKLQSLGFDIINDKKARTIERIKTLIIDQVHHQHHSLKTNLSEYLAQQLNQDYNSLSSLFSGVENTTIEQYWIAQKIEKIKELIIYDELSLSEIADNLGYSSLAHLSNQFKKVTGFAPSYYKKLKTNKRKHIDAL